MINLNEYRNDTKYAKLPDVVKKVILKFDSILTDFLKDKNIRQKYRGKWRNDSENGYKVSVLEFENYRGRRKNIVTLRPKNAYLTVEVYWSKDNKRFFDLYQDNAIPDELMNEISNLLNQRFKFT